MIAIEKMLYSMWILLERKYIQRHEKVVTQACSYLMKLFSYKYRNASTWSS